MKVRRLFSQSVSLILTCCLLFELLPSTVAATVAEVADSFENAVNENLEMEAIPFSGENSALETEQTVVDTEESEYLDYSKNAAFKTSGLTLDVFKKASKLHGGDNAFSRELAALNSGVVDDSLSKTDATNIRQLICSGYTYRQARAAIVSIETLENCV